MMSCAALSECASYSAVRFSTSPDDLPVVTRLEASPLSSTPGPGAISLGWTNPPSECYRFSSHSVACDSSDAETPPSMGSAAVEGSASATEVTSLAVDRAYTCQVLSTVSDAEGNNFPETSASQSVDSFTYPDCKYCSLYYPRVLVSVRYTCVLFLYYPRVLVSV